MFRCHLFMLMCLLSHYAVKSLWVGTMSCLSPCLPSFVTSYLLQGFPKCLINRRILKKIIIGINNLKKKTPLTVTSHSGWLGLKWTKGKLHNSNPYPRTTLSNNALKEECDLTFRLQANVYPRFCFCCCCFIKMWH